MDLSVHPLPLFDCGRETGFCSFMNSGIEHLTSLLASAGGRLLMPRDEGEQVLGALCNWKCALFGDKEKKGSNGKVQDLLLINFLSSDQLLVLSVHPLFLLRILEICLFSFLFILPQMFVACPSCTKHWLQFFPGNLLCNFHYYPASPTAHIWQKKH